MKNLKKLLAVVLTVAMMASFMVMPAFAADLSADAKIAADLGMLIGEGSGVTTAYTATEPSRMQAAVMLLRLTGKADEAAAFTGTDNFSDVTAAWMKPYTAYLKANPDAGFQGIGDNKFDPDTKITAQQYYKVVLTALGYVADTDYAYADTISFAASKGLTKVASVTKFTVNDIAIATVEALKATVKGGTATLVEKLVADGTIAAAKAEVAGLIAPAGTFAVKASGAKKIEVSFGKAVDTTKAVFTVKRETVKINTSNITWNDAKSVATLELASKMSKATYNVEVTGLGDTALKASIAVEDEKVTKISILSTDAPLFNMTNNVTDDAKVDDLLVRYKVFNQYDEDVTKVTSLQVSSSGAHTEYYPNKGTIEIEGNTNASNDGFNEYLNNKAAVTLIHLDSGVSATATLTVVAQAKVDQISVVGLYNKDGKTLTEATDLAADPFYVEIAAKDQYGQEVDPSGNPSSLLMYSESNNTLIKVDGQAVSGVNKPNVLDTVVDDRYFIQLKGVVDANGNAGGNFAKVGDSTIILIAQNTGKSAQYVVSVAESARPNSMVLGQPDLVSGGDVAYLPLSVYDVNGEEIKDLGVLNTSARKLTVNVSSGIASIVLKDGSVYVKVTGNTAGNVVSVTVSTSVAPFKSVNANYTVKDAALPKTIVGLKSTIGSTVHGSIYTDIKASDLIIEDQYGRQMAKSDINAWIDGGNSIKLESTTGTTTGFEVYSTDDGIVDGATRTINSSTDKFTVAPIPGSAAALNEKLTFTLVQGATPVTASAKDIVFNKVSSWSEFASFRIDAPDLAYNGTAAYVDSDHPGDTFNVKVYGVKSDGTEVLLDPAKYSLSYSTSTFATPNITNGTQRFILQAPLANTVIDDEDSTTVPESKEYTFTATVGNTAATQVSKKIAVSARDRDIASLKFTKDGTSDGAAFDGSNFKLLVGNTTLAADDIAQYLYAKDIFGKGYKNYNVTTGTAPLAKITFSNLKKSTGSTAVIDIASNGSNTAHIDNVSVGDMVTVTIVEDGVTATMDVIVVAP